jgi:hypothetical protein
MSQGNYLAAALITEMSTQIANDANFTAPEFSITYPANKFRITSTTKGTSSNIEVFEGANDFLQTVELDGDVPLVGGGDVTDIDAVTASEIASILNIDISGISASDDGGQVRITTISTNGTVSSIEITGGTAIAIIGFSIGTTRGLDKNNSLKVDIDSDTAKNPIELATDVNPIAATSVSSDIQTKLQAIGAGGYTSALCTFNETTFFQVFTNALRILSGTYGVASSVDVNDNTIIIAAGVNDKFDFEETGSVQLTATLSVGFYDGTSLATEIQTQLNSVGASTYSVSFSTVTKKMTITSNGAGGAGIFTMLFLTGTNTASTIANTIGFYDTIDHTGLLSYVSDGLVKVDNVVEELGFDSQTTEQGHGIDDILLYINDSFLWVDLDLDTGGGVRRDLTIDITLSPNDKIGGLISTINNYVFTSYDNFYTCDFDFAYLLGRVSEKFRINDGDILIVEANGTGNQTITFSAPKATSTSASSPFTRVFSGVNDRLRLNVNGLGTETSVSGESLFSGPALGGETNFTTVNAPIKVGSTSISLIRSLPPLFIPLPVTLSEGVDYTVNYGTGDITIIGGLITLDSSVDIDYTYLTVPEIIIGTQLTPEKISAKIQQEVRNITTSSIEDQAAFLGFTCVYSGGRYILSTGTGGTGSSIQVYDGSINSAAPGLKIGIDYGGTEVVGSGDFVNSEFATVLEINAKITASAVGFTATGPDYVKLTSTVFGNTTRIQVKSSLAKSKLGFDSNDDSNPSVNLSTIDSSTIIDVAGTSIKSPTVYTSLRGWQTDKGNVIITYQTIDDSRIPPRKSVVSTRLPTIPPRKPLIISEASTASSGLIPILFQARKEAVQLRLNRNTGSYVKVGDKYNQIDNNNDTIAINTQYIDDIDLIL